MQNLLVIDLVVTLKKSNIMKMKQFTFPSTLFAIFITLILQVLPQQIHAQTEKIHICLLSELDYNKADKETKASYDFLKANFNYSPDYLTFNQIKNDPEKIIKFEIIWFHRPDTSNFSNIETDNIVISALRKYVENGGNLILTLDAFKYIIELGVEPVKPEIRQKEAVDKGYGRILGLHCFRSHPIFDGLNGGAYINKPHSDTVVRQIGYFNNSIPKNGKVVAVDWDYIFVRENSKLILEYNLGKGKIIAVGAYTFYAEPNYNYPHLKLFTENIINYLTSNYPESKIYYWEYGKNQVLHNKLNDSIYNFSGILNTFKTPENWDKNQNSLCLSDSFATENYWDVAGQRMLISGRILLWL